MTSRNTILFVGALSKGPRKALWPTSLSNVKKASYLGYLGSLGGVIIIRKNNPICCFTFKEQG
jgi:hypothetical protein